MTAPHLPPPRRPSHARAAGLAPALALALAALPGSGRAQSPARAPDAALAARLQDARDAFSSAYVEGRFDDLALAYTEDAVLLPGSAPVQGRDAIRRYFTYGPGRTQVAHSMTPTLVTVEGPTVVEVGVWSSTVRRGDEPPSTASGRHMLVWRHQPDGRWLIAYDTWHQRPPMPEPRLVGEGVVSSPDRNETWPALDPVDGSLWFSVYNDDFDAQRIVRAPLVEEGAWGEAGPVPFSDGRHGDRAPRFSLDGARLFFTSDRPGGGGGGLDLWVVERTGDGWSEPRPLPPPVASPGPDMHASETDDGTLFLATRRPGGAGRSDLVRVERRGGGWGPAEPLPPEVNDGLSQSDVLVAPDGSWIVVAVTDHPRGLGGDDLFLSRRTAHGWTPLEHLPAPLNSEAYEYGPSLSPDGRWLWFTSHRRGTADVYRVPLAALGLDPAR